MMAFSLNNKNALITGGTAGIGLAVAKRFVQHGAKVVISSRRSTGAAVAKDIGAHFIQADATQDTDLEKLFEQAQAFFGEMHIVVNNAGMSVGGRVIAKQHMSDVDALFQLNLRAAYKVLQLAAQHVVPGGSIINTASVAAFEGMAHGSAYNASKAAIVSLTKSVALELANQSIRVNAVSPGLIESEIWQGTTPDELIKQRVPLQRMGSGDEAAAVFQFLASDEASYVTGANYLVDGGYSAGPVMNV